jgi:hypothetical protein
MKPYRSFQVSLEPARGHDPPTAARATTTRLTPPFDGEIELDRGRVLPFAYAMIVPPFSGVDAVRDSEGLANPMGFVPDRRPLPPPRAGRCLRRRSGDRDRAT